MKKTAILTMIVAMFATFTFIFSSCQPYEEGPSFSLLSKTSRLAGEWSMEKVLINDTEEDLASTQPRMTFEKDGSGDMTVSFLSLNITVDLEWEFVGDDGIKYRVKDENATWQEWTEYTILRLSKDELFIERTYLDEDSETNVTERVEFAKV